MSQENIHQLFYPGGIRIYAVSWVSCGYYQGGVIATNVHCSAQQKSGSEEQSLPPVPQTDPFENAAVSEWVDTGWTPVAASLSRSFPIFQNWLVRYQYQVSTGCLYPSALIITTSDVKITSWPVFLGWHATVSVLQSKSNDLWIEVPNLIKVFCWSPD